MYCFTSTNILHQTTPCQ